jgi:hypothetical protein
MALSHTSETEASAFPCISPVATFSQTASQFKLDSLSSSSHSLVAVGSNNPQAAGMMAHFLAVAFHVNRRLWGIAPEVAVFTPVDFAAPELVLALGEPTQLADLSFDVPLLGAVTYGLPEEDVRRRLSHVQNLSVYRLDEEALFDETQIECTTVEFADQCIAIAAHIMSSLVVKVPKI